MKKLHLVALLGLFAAFCGMLFTSCNKSDDDPSEPIVGTWSQSASYSDASMSSSSTISFNFTSNGKYTFTQEEKHKSPEFTEEMGNRETGTYTLSGNTLTLTPKTYAWKEHNGKWQEESAEGGRSWSQEIAIEGKTLYISLWEGGEQIALKKK